MKRAAFVARLSTVPILSALPVEAKGEDALQRVIELVQRGVDSVVPGFRPHLIRVETDGVYFEYRILNGKIGRALRIPFALEAQGQDGQIMMRAKYVARAVLTRELKRYLRVTQGRDRA